MIKSDFFQYLILISILVTGGLFFVMFPLALHKFYVVIATIIAYMGWGIFHHGINERLSFWVFLEYFLISALVIAFFAFSLKLS